MDVTQRIEDWGGSGPTLLFAHGNGFPPGSYARLLTTLSRRFRVLAVRARPLWSDGPAAELVSWEQLADDYCEVLNALDVSCVHGVGHSLGAVLTLMAATRLPERFERLTLIEPVVMPRLSAWVFAALPLCLRKRTRLARGANARTDHWDDLEHAYRDHRRHHVFARIDDRALRAHVQAATRADENGGLTLSIPRAWESQIFACVPSIAALRSRVTVPLRLLRGTTSDECSADAADAWRRARPDHELFELDYAGHLLPLERPFETAALVDATARSPVSAPLAPAGALSPALP
jgi:pimeloyl-ACP methyl ester carboxylesterase